jgi:hypothetical protein
MRVGLELKADDWYERRGIPFYVLKPLFNVPHINFYILQADAMVAGWEEGISMYPAVQPHTHFSLLVRAMNLVITIDARPAHLAVRSAYRFGTCCMQKRIGCGCKIVMSVLSIQLCCFPGKISKVIGKG